MGISRSSFSAQSIAVNTDITIQMLAAPPDTTVILETPVTPGVMVGFYNDQTDTVELYVTDPTGLRYIKVR